ncbi:MAG: response regulator [Elusimicrobiota bacterium]
MKKILIADDEDEIRNLLAMAITSRGYEVITCADGGEALEKIKEAVPDLLILDVMMPVIDGLHLCHQIVFESEIYPTPKIILLTCRKEDRDKEMGANIGADLYLTKPFSLDDIMDRVKELIGEP